MKSIKDSESYFAALASAMERVAHSGVDHIAAELLEAYECGRSIYIFGNGGSAATASHFACDLSKGTTKWLTKSDRRFRVVALTDNIPVMTAWANDSDYQEIFAEQLRNLIRPGDVAIAISGSGNSANIIRALEVANCHGAHTIGFAGFGGGRMKPLCRTCLVVASDNMEVIEDVHMAVCHALATIIRHMLMAMTDRSQARGAKTAAACSTSRTLLISTRTDETAGIDFRTTLPATTAHKSTEVASSPDAE